MIKRLCDLLCSENRIILNAKNECSKTRFYKKKTQKSIQFQNSAEKFIVDRDQRLWLTLIKLQSNKMINSLQQNSSIIYECKRFSKELRRHDLSSKRRQRCTSQNNSIWFDFDLVFFIIQIEVLRFDFCRFDSIWFEFFSIWNRTINKHCKKFT